MGFTFESPISPWSSAYDKAHRSRSTTYPLPSSKSKSKKAPALLDKIKTKARRPFTGSGGSPSAIHTAKSTINPTPAKQSQLFRLPLAVREKIYGFTVGQNELLHILLRYRASPSRWKVAYRRCGAGGDVEYCVLKNCREFHDVVKGSYFGYFDHVSGLFLTCRDIYKEASHVLYTQNTLEFDHPLTLITFSGEVSQSSLHSIRSISIDLQRNIYAGGANNVSLCTSLHSGQWLQMWSIISTMQGLEEIRVRFQLLVDGWLGWTEKEVLEPLCKVKRPLKVFEVEMPLSSKAISSNSDGDDDGEEKVVPFKLVKY